MTVMLMPSNRRLSAKPKLAERQFRVQLRCPCCRGEEAIVVSALDEPGDPATVHDFMESGALETIEHACRSCGEEMTIIKQVDYVRTPEEARGEL